MPDIVLDKRYLEVPFNNKRGASAVANLMNTLRINNQLQYFDALYVFASYNSQGSIDIPTSVLPSRNIDSKLNRISNNYHATEISLPLFLFGYGWRGDAVSNIALSLINPATGGLNYTLNDCHLGLYNLDNIEGGIELGNRTAAPSIRGAWIASKYTGGNCFLNLNGAAGISFGAAGDCRGWWYGERTNATQVTLYKNNVSLGTLASASVGIASLPIYALGVNSDSAILATSQSAKKMALCHVGKSGMDRAIVGAAFNQFIIDNRYA